MDHEDQGLIELWLRPISTPSPRRLVSLVGPPGSGKSSISKALADFAWPGGVAAHEERADLNPYFEDGRSPKDDELDASQNWFLAQYESKLRDAKSTLILDQHPIAVVLAYSRAFCDQGLISIQSYSVQAERLRGQIEVSRRDFPSQFNVFLTAPKEVLATRIARKSDGQLAMDWLDKIVPKFDVLLAEGQSRATASMMHIDTADRRVDDVAHEIFEAAMKNGRRY
jgi:broad-specificity NMP kinase